MKKNARITNFLAVPGYFLFRNLTFLILLSPMTANRHFKMPPSSLQTVDPQVRLLAALLPVIRTAAPKVSQDDK